MRFSRVLVLFVSLLGACAADPLEAIDDSAGGDVELGAADSASGGDTYYLARMDTRRCAWPYCGGVWVHRPNSTRVRCADGRWASECYVTDIDSSGLGISAEQASELDSRFSSGQAIVTGSFVPTSTSGLSYTVLRVAAAWEAASDASTDEILYSVEDNGIRCVRAPCFSLDEAKLNSTIDRTLSGIDWASVGLTSAQEGAVSAALGGAGVLAAGHNVRNRRTGAVTLVASQAYLPVLPSPTTCASTADCGMTFYPTLVTSEADCYCPGCPTPALAATASANQAAWNLYCSATHGIDVCPLRSCAPPPPVACHADGVCGYGAPEI